MALILQKQSGRKESVQPGCAEVPSMGALSQVSRGEADRRRPLEECIKRPYFHVKPLDAVQLTAWSRLLDYTEARGDQAAVIHAYERCLVATALYPGLRLTLSVACCMPPQDFLQTVACACALVK